MTEKVLSIAIPTYNRAKLLKATLKNLISQVKKYHLEGFVNFLVSDNASEDNTHEVIAELSAQYPDLINYNRNSKNVVWENIRIVAEMSTGRYVWLCSDDEQYKDGILKKVVDVVRQNKYKFIYVNNEQNFGKYHIACDVEEDKVCSPQEFIDIAFLDLATLSSCILRKDVISKIPTKYVTWYHFEKAFNLDKNDKCYIISYPYIIYDKISSWNVPQNRLKYFTELYAIVSESNQPQNIKDKFLKSKYLRNACYRDIFVLKRQKDKSVKFDDIKSQLIDICNKNNCPYFDKEIKLLNSKYLWYLLYRINTIRDKIKNIKFWEFINNVGHNGKRTRTAK